MNNPSCTPCNSHSINKVRAATLGVVVPCTPPVSSSRAPVAPGAPARRAAVARVHARVPVSARRLFPSGDEEEEVRAQQAIAERDAGRALAGNRARALEGAQYARVTLECVIQSFSEARARGDGVDVLRSIATQCCAAERVLIAAMDDLVHAVNAYEEVFGIE